jgi:hypothetical protein
MPFRVPPSVNPNVTREFKRNRFSNFIASFFNSDTTPHNMSEVVVPVAPCYPDDSPEAYALRGDILAFGHQLVGAGAGFLSRASLTNRRDRSIVVVRNVTIQQAAIGFVRIYLVRDGVIAGDIGSTTQSGGAVADTRVIESNPNGGPPFSASIVWNNAAVGLLNSGRQIGFYNNTAADQMIGPIDLPLILKPGWALAVEGSVLNTALLVNFAWYERAVTDASEVSL